MILLLVNFSNGSQSGCEWINDNMVTTPHYMMVKALYPGIFEKCDVESLINKATRFFDALSMNKITRSLLVLGAIIKELRHKYEATKKSGDK